MSNRPQGTAPLSAEERRAAMGNNAGSTGYSGQRPDADVPVAPLAADIDAAIAHEEAAHTLDRQLHTIARMREQMQADKQEIERLKARTRTTLARLRAA